MLHPNDLLDYAHQQQHERWDEAKRVAQSRQLKATTRLPRRRWARLLAFFAPRSEPQLERQTTQGQAERPQPQKRAA